jgi:uncharacterized protein (TIGR02117 family)
MKKALIILLKIVGYPILGFILFILLYLLAGWGLSNSSTAPKAVTCYECQTIYIASNGVHLDIVLPVELLDTFLYQHLHQKGNYLAFGWGDEGFYLHTKTWDDVKFNNVFKAAFLPSPTLMHVTHYGYPSSLWTPIELCPEQLQQIQYFIRQSFREDSDCSFFELTNQGYSSIDYFYEAEGSYSCFYTCNVWVNQALKKGQVKTAIWSPSIHGVLSHQ